MANNIQNFVRSAFYIDSKNEETWQKVFKHEIVDKYNIDKLQVVCMAIAIGYTDNLKLKGTFTNNNGGWLQQVRGGNIDTILRKNTVALIVSIAVKEKGLEILDEDKKIIQNISHEYANGGIKKLLKILNQEDEEKAITTLYSYMKKAAK